MSEPADKTDLENRVLALMENEKAPASEWIEALEAGRKAGLPEATGAWAEMAQEALARAGDSDGGTALLKWRADFTPIESMTGKAWVKAADTVAGSDPHLLAPVPPAAKSPARDALPAPHLGVRRGSEDRHALQENRNQFPRAPGTRPGHEGGRRNPGTVGG